MLDFWRGVSILMVLLHHLGYYHFALGREFVASASFGASLLSDARLLGATVLVEVSKRSGQLGVKTFFVISGFIITKLMLQEETRNGRTSIGRFYFRRAFRIIPAYFFYLLGVAVFGALHWTPVDQAQIPYAMAFLCNTELVECDWNLVHTWTLAVEEQFYLAWPLLFVLIGQRWRTAFLAGVLGLLIALSSSGVLVAHAWIDNPLAFTCIATGALYAVSAGFRAYVQRFGVATTAVALGLLATAALLSPRGVETYARIAYAELTPFFILTLIVASYRVPRLIASKPFKWVTRIGLISYSLYLWQQVFSGPAIAAGSPLQWWPLMVAFALFSYFCIERPAIAWARRRLRTPAR